MADDIRIGIVAEDRTSAGISSAKRNLQGLEQSAQSINRTLSMGQAAVAGFMGGFASTAIPAAIGGLKNLAGGAVDAYASYERLGQSIQAMAAKEALLTGSATNMAQALAMTKTQSKETLDWITKLAIQSPFKQEDVAQAFRLAQALGFNTQEAKRLTAATLDWATATGAQGYDIERVNRALGQMQVKGKVSQEEINQLTEAGVDAQRILVAAFGKSGKALDQSFQNGSITAKQAVEAIVTDMEKLYSGAGKMSAGSFAGLLSSLDDLRPMILRNLFGGMIEEAQPYIAEFVGVLSAPEFQAGITALGQQLGGGLKSSLDEISAGVTSITTAIDPLLKAGAPPWLVALQAFQASIGKPLDVKITPTVTEIKYPASGLSIKVDAIAERVTIANKDGNGVFLTAKWQEGVIGSLFAGAQDLANAKPILLKAGWSPDWANTLTQMLSFGATAGKVAAGINSLFNGQMMFNVAANVQANWGTTWTSAYNATASIFADWGATWTTVYNATASIFADWGDTWTQVYSAVVQFLPDLSQIPGWVQGMFGGGNSAPTAPRGSADNARRKGGDYGGTAPYVPATRTKAVGTEFFGGGLALVGETGPEVVILPRGAAVMSNYDTRRTFGGIPRFADGTTGAGAFGDALRGLARMLGLWKGESYGPPAPSGPAWNDFLNTGKNAMQKAAATAGTAFTDAAKGTARDWKNAIQGALGKVPGLFGTSEVTDRQMKLAAAGVPQNFADDYLRRLTDEVLNGKDWAGVDIKDAAKRAGIDPNLPNEIILDLVKEAWSNGSFFANKENLGLINTDAVKANLEQQQKEMQGKQNLMAMFGLADPNNQAQIDALGQGIAAIWGQASQSTAVQGAGKATMASMMTGMADPATAAAGMTGVGNALTTAIGTPENIAILQQGGQTAAATWLAGWKAYMAGATVPPPSGVTPPLPPANTSPTAPQKAIGTDYWYGGAVTVHRNETLYLPRGTRIARPGQGGGNGAVVNNYVTINQRVDEEAFLAKMARRLRAGR